MMGKAIEHLAQLLKEKHEFNDFVLKEYTIKLRNYDRFYIFGSGASGEMMADYFVDKFQDKKLFFIDNDVKKQNTKLYRTIPCVPPTVINEIDAKSSVIFVASVQYAWSIVSQLIANYGESAYRNYVKTGGKSYFYIHNGIMVDVELVFALHESSYNHYDYAPYNLLSRLDADLLSEIFGYFSDDLSQKIFLRKVYDFSGNGQENSDICTWPQYYPPEIKRHFSDHEVFLDCGAEYGDTIKQFILEVDGRYDAIYAFEMDACRYNELIKTAVVSDNRICCFNCGVSDRNDTIEYSTYGCPTYINAYRTDDNISTAKIRTVDSMIDEGKLLQEVTFVKMDIEGAELDALHGMEKMIIRCRPKLAICVYHKPDDIISIPQYIKKLVPEYKFILRHHSPYDTETVLYAFLE